MINYTGQIDGIIKDLFNLDKDVIYDVKIEKHKEKRSKNQNSYMWELINKIANETRISKEEVYMQMLRDYGQSQMLPYEIDKTPAGWFKYYEYVTTSKLNGKDADWYKVYKGSSEYNSLEMSVLLDGVIQEATNLGIPVILDE